VRQDAEAPALLRWAGNCRNREIRQLSPPDFLYLSIGASSVAVMIVVTIMVMVMGADTDTDRTDMDTDDGGAGGGGAQQSQGENRRNKRFHDDCLSKRVAANLTAIR
jgi:hypothetical protein